MSHTLCKKTHIGVIQDAALPQDSSPPACLPWCRPNLVVSGMPAYAEDSWRQLSIAASNSIPAPAAASAAPAPAPSFVQLDSAGPCTRCDMICADPLTGRYEAGVESAGLSTA